MPITASAKKALRQSIRHRVTNRTRKDAFRKAVKTYRKLVSEKKFADATKEFPKVSQALDKAAKDGAITKNKASRLKSRLAKSLKNK